MDQIYSDHFLVDQANESVAPASNSPFTTDPDNEARVYIWNRSCHESYSSRREYWVYSSVRNSDAGCTFVILSLNMIGLAVLLAVWKRGRFGHFSAFIL